MSQIKPLLVADLDHIIRLHGVSLSVYLSPSYSTDDEGSKVTITLGSATSATGILTEISGEEVTPEIEGVDLDLTFRCFLPASTGTIEEDDIVEHNSERYKIVRIINTPLESTNTTFYELIIERIQGATYA